MAEVKYIETEHGRFYDRIDEEGNIIQTAEDWYQDWLADKDKPSEPRHDKIDILEQENKALKSQVEAMLFMQDFYEECIVEIASLVYA